MNFKKRTNFLFGALLLTGSLLAQNVCVSTPKTSLVLSAPEGGTLRHLYYGNRLSEADLQNISAAEANHAAYPEYGLNAPVETALAVKHADPPARSIERDYRKGRECRDDCRGTEG